MMGVAVHRIAKCGRLVFAVAIVAFGAENLICARVGGDAMPVIPFVPAYPLAVWLTGAFLVAAGLSIAANKWVRQSATLFAIFFILCALLLEVPRAIAHPLDIGIRTVVFEPLAIAGAALVLAAALPGDARFSRWAGALGRYLFAVSAVVFGIDHFFILAFIASLVPPWIPGGLFWAWLTGAGFIAAGLSIASGWMERWGAFMLGTMFALWVLVLHGPRVLGLSRVVGAPRNPNEWSSAFIAVAMCGGAWILAEASSRRKEV